MSERVTLRDVADKAGVHVSTASRALNETTRAVVNPSTVSRVLEAASALGYSPNPMARGLRTNRSMTVGIVIPDIQNPLFGPIISGAESALGRAGYSLLITDTAPSGGAQVASITTTLLDRRVDGIILATATLGDRTIDDLVERGVPAVLVNRMSEHEGIPHIVGDDRTGIGLVVRHLAGLGHHRIGHLSGPTTLSTGVTRLAAFREQMAELSLSAEAVEEAEWYQVDPGYRAASRLLDRFPDLTALVGANDLIALGAYRAVRERGLAVGDDIAVTGYNDIPLLDLMSPPLTSVRVPYREMGTEAALMLLSIVERSDETPRTSMQLAPSLSIRESSGGRRSG